MAYFLSIDQEGHLMSEGRRLNDNAFGKTILENLFVDNRVYKSTYESKTCGIYNFDHPLIVQFVEKSVDKLKLIFLYEYELSISASELMLDEWDRFCGYTEKGIAFVFSRKAQAAFFDLLDEFTDESITLDGQEYVLPNFLPNSSEVNEKFWTNKYIEWKDTGEKPGWDLKKAHPAISDVLPQIKMNKASIAVLGAGAAHDAAFLATKGHIVTAFDISAEAIEKAKSLYPETTNLKYVQADMLAEIPEQYRHQFDLVFEHTFFCAINPAERKTAVQTYKNLLHEEGHILGIFFVITTEPGPPFGATEWELNQRFEKSFRPLYWTRWTNSPTGREAWELVAYLQKN